MKNFLCLFVTLSLSVCLAGCSRPTERGNQFVQDYSEEYEVSPYGKEEELDSLTDLKITLNPKKDFDLKQVSFLIENNSDKDFQYSAAYYEIEAEQSGIWYQLRQLKTPAGNDETDCIIRSGERLTLKADIKRCYGELPAGHYRLIQQFAYFEHERDWDYKTFYVSCEFTI